MSSKQLSLIVDGPDRCGKSHIAHELSKQLVVPYFKHSAEHDMFKNHPERFVNATKYGDSYFVDYLKQTGASVVLDRCYPSEYVYSRVFKRQIDMDALRYVDNKHAELGTSIILCRRHSYDNVYDDKYPDILGPHKLTLIDAYYNEFAAWSQCNVMTLWVDDENLDREITEILEFLKVF